MPRFNIKPLTHFLLASQASKYALHIDILVWVSTVHFLSLSQISTSSTLKSTKKSSRQHVMNESKDAQRIMNESKDA